MTNYKGNVCPTCGINQRVSGNCYCRACLKEYNNKPQAKANRAAYRAFPNVQPCEKCGSTIKVQRHHDDYSKPLEIRWLCLEHHVEHHRQAHIFP